MKPELDVWSPGEHNGTFRGHCPAFVTATAALDYWMDSSFELSVRKKSRLVQRRLEEILQQSSVSAKVRGRGLIWGVEFENPELAAKISAACFERGMIIETAGIDDQVLKLLPSLTIEDADLLLGLEIIEQSIADVSAELATASH
jgi:diaminobutyrate-2-oxoglutarate transaminase